MNDLDLFGRPAPDRDPAPGLEETATAPLAARMRPQTLDEFVGQEHLLGPGRSLRELIERDEVGSLILWGPPGTGKTTLARIIAERTRAVFVQFSAVTEGVARVREVIREARTRLRAGGPRTTLFCDEIHRFNKAQQDAFLPHVEAGSISLIGATTENPSFEVIGALLSRSRVFVLEPLDDAHISIILRRALADEDRGLGQSHLEIDDADLDLLARYADGDARRALNALETAATLVRPRSDSTGPPAAEAPARITERVIREALQLRFSRYDKGGEEHYNLISALHKAVRGSDPQAALYWLARMLDGGEDSLYISRRLVRMAVEDVGLADPRALEVTIAARDAYQFLGSPEGELALAEAAVYLATAPKSNRLYTAMARAMEAARRTPAAPVPMHVRNAPTRLMRDLGYGRGYRYAFDSEEHFLPQSYLPEGMEDASFYEPSTFGFETRIRERLAWWEERRRDATSSSDRDEDRQEPTAAQGTPDAVGGSDQDARAAASRRRSQKPKVGRARGAGSDDDDPDSGAGTT